MPRTYRKTIRRRPRTMARRPRRRFVRYSRRRRHQRRMLWPARTFAKLRYVDIDTPSLTISSGNTFHTNGYNLNNLYDVNKTVMSTTVPGFHEYAQMWKKYRVTGAKIVCETASNAPILIGIHFTNEVWTPANWAEVMRVLNGNNNSIVKMQNPGEKSVTKLYRNLGKVLGNQLAYKGSDNYNANVITGPNDIIHGYLMSVRSDGITGTELIVYAKITVTLYVEFYERMDQAKT